MPFFDVKPEYQHAALICSGLVLSLFALLLSLIGNSFWLRARIGIAAALALAACLCAGLSAAHDEAHITVGAAMIWCMGGLTAWLAAAQLKGVKRKESQALAPEAKQSPPNRS